MALRQSYTAQVEIPEPLREHYTEKDGKWLLQTDPPTEDVSGLKSALESERRLKRDAETALSTMKSKYEGIDPDEVATLRERVESLKDKEIYDANGLEALLARRTQQMKDEHARVVGTKDREIGTLKETAATLDRKWRQDRIETALIAAATEAGVAKGAVGDAVRRGREVFVDLNEQGQPIAKIGDDIRYGNDGVHPLTPKEWLLSLKPEPDSAHLWPPSSGSGAPAHHNGTPGGIDYAAIKSPTERITALRQAQRGGTRG